MMPLVCVCKSATEIYKRVKLIPDVLYGENKHLYENESWWRGKNADGFSSQVITGNLACLFDLSCHTTF